MTISDFLAQICTIEKAYSKQCQNIVVKYNISRTAFDIMMFLTNNKKYYTANAISEVKNIKPNVVSLHVDRLVNDGYIERQSVEGDRRKVRLVCTEKAQPIIADGKKMQQHFFEVLLEGLSEQDLDAFKKYFEVMADNASQMIKSEDK